MDDVDLLLDAWGSVRAAHGRVARLLALAERGVLRQEGLIAGLEKLERELAEATELILQAQPEDVADSATLARDRVLIVDDDPGFGQGLRRRLEASGFRAFVEASPTNALPAFDMLRPSLAFVDINMPGRSGHEVAGELKASDPDVAVVLMTGYFSAENVFQAGRFADVVADKSIGIPALVDLAKMTREGQTPPSVLSAEVALKDEEIRRRNARLAYAQTGSLSGASEQLELDRRTVKRLIDGEDEEA